VTEVTGEAQWGSPLTVELGIRFTGAPPPDSEARIRRVLTELLGDDLARLERQLAPISVQPAGNQMLRVRLLFDDVALERAANRAAELVERALGPGAGAGIGL
jgi:hypothetical protein